MNDLQSVGVATEKANVITWIPYYVDSTMWSVVAQFLLPGENGCFVQLHKVMPIVNVFIVVFNHYSTLALHVSALAIKK